MPDVANSITASLANAATGHNKDENVLAFDAYNQTETGGVSKTVAARNDQDTASCVAYPINTQLGLRGPDTSNTSREGVGTGGENDPAYTLQAGHTHGVAYAITPMNNAKDYGADATEELSPTLRAGGFTNSHQNGGVMPPIAFSSGDSGQDAAVDIAPTIRKGGDGGGNMPAVAVAVGFNEDGTTRTLTARYDSSPCADRGPDVVAFQSSQSGVRLGNTHATLDANNGPRRHNGALVGSAARRLTPVECERLQGFPDNFTAIPWKKKGPEACPDGPRYKALGNSMAVPVMRWIGERIQLVDDLISVL